MDISVVYRYSHHREKLLRTGVVPAPDGKIYLVDMNETHYWGSLVRYMYWGQKYFSEKIETYQYIQKKKVNVLMEFFYSIFRFIGKKKVPQINDLFLRGHILEPNLDDFETKSS